MYSIFSPLLLSLKALLFIFKMSRSCPAVLVLYSLFQLPPYLSPSFYVLETNVKETLPYIFIRQSELLVFVMFYFSASVSGSHSDLRGAKMPELVEWDVKSVSEREREREREREGWIELNSAVGITRNSSLTYHRVISDVEAFSSPTAYFSTNHN